MKITTRISIQMDAQRKTPRVDAVQCDANTRVLKISLYSNGSAWSVPDETDVSVAYRKSDGTKGWYNKLPNGKAACSVEDNVVTVTLAPQVLTAPGLVKVVVIMKDSDTLDQLATFPVEIHVEPNPAAGNAISNDYYNYSTMAEVNTALNEMTAEINTALSVAKAYYIRIEEDEDGNLIADKLFDEIRTHYHSGASLFANYNGIILHLSFDSSSVDRSFVFEGTVENEHYRFTVYGDQSVDGARTVLATTKAVEAAVTQVAEDAKTLRVNVSITDYAEDGTGTGFGLADKTLAEIAAAVNSGRSVCAVDDEGIIYSLVQSDSEIATFLMNLADVVYVLSVFEEGVMREAYPLVTPEQIPTKVSQLENDGGFLSMDNCVVYGANLASLGEVVEGYFVSPTTGNPAIAPNSKYTTIPIPDGKELTVGFGCHIYAFEASNTGGVSFLDKDMNNLGVVDVKNFKIGYTHNGYPCATIPIPEGAAYFRCTLLLYNTSTNSVKWDATDTLLVAIGNAKDVQHPRIATIDGYRVYAEDQDSGKKMWALIGDSLTAVNTTAASKYHNYVAEELNLSTSNHARSGAGFTSGTTFSTQIAELAQEDCDVITIFTSGNDCDNDPPLGSVTDTGSDTLCGVINTTLDELFALKPFVSVGIITSCPWKWFMPSTPGNLMENYNNAIMEIARRRGIPVLDLYHSSNMRPDNEGFRVKFYNENGVQDNGVHPNSEGHKILAAPIREFVRSLIRP